MAFFYVESITKLSRQDPFKVNPEIFFLKKDKENWEIASVKEEIFFEREEIAFFWRIWI